MWCFMMFYVLNRRFQLKVSEIACICHDINMYLKHPKASHSIPDWLVYILLWKLLQVQKFGNVFWEKGLTRNAWCMNIHMYIHVYCICISIICIYLYVYIYMYIFICIYLYVCIYIFTFIHMFYVCMHMYIYTHII